MSRKKTNVQISVKLSVSNERITKEEAGGERCRIIVCDVNVFLGRKSWCFLKKNKKICVEFFCQWRSEQDELVHCQAADSRVRLQASTLSSKTSYRFCFPLSRRLVLVVLI